MFERCQIYIVCSPAARPGSSYSRIELRVLLCSHVCQAIDITRSHVSYLAGMLEEIYTKLLAVPGTY